MSERDDKSAVKAADEGVGAALTGRDDAEVRRWTDAYFNRTKTTIEAFGDCQVTYAVFMRRPVVSAPRLAIDWLHAMARRRMKTA